MKFIVTILVTALLAWPGSWLLAWWMIALVPFVVAIVLKQKPGRGFLSGFIAIALLWFYLSLKADIANEHILSTRIAELFGLSHNLFIIVNILVGALAGGLGGWSGAAITGKKKG